MKVRDFMTEAVVTISPEQTVCEAAGVMRDRGVGCLVVAADREVRGIVTDRDIVVRAGCSPSRLSEISVASVMTENVIAVHDDVDVEFVLSLMRNHGIRRIPVLNEFQKLVGIISVADLSDILKRDTSNYLDAISSHSHVKG